MRKVFLSLILVIGLFTLTGCGKQEEQKEGNKNALAFKSAYEGLNGKMNAKGTEYRRVSISESNPFEEVTAKDILAKIDAKETFYVYFGDEMCPWCRSVVEKSIEVAKKSNINKIYYVSIWNENHEEVLRDTYKLNSKNKAVLDKKGTEEYSKLLSIFDKVLKKYELTISEGKNKGKKVSTGEKRIYAPNFIYVENGEAVRMVTGISEKQTGANDELTEEILNDEVKLFEEFFK